MAAAAAAAVATAAGEYLRPHSFLWKWMSSLRTSSGSLAFGYSRQRASISRGARGASSAGTTTTTMMGDGAEVALLEAKEDRYDGVIINPETLPEDAEVFRKMLKNSLQKWKDLGR